MTGPAAPLDLRSASITVIAQFGGRAAYLVLALASVGVVTRAIGATGYADWGTALSFAAMFGFLLDPGLTPVVVRRIVQDPSSSPTPGELLRLRLGLAGAAIVLVVGGTVALRGWETAPLALALAAQLAPRAVVLNSGAWLQAGHRLHRQTTVEAATAALGLAILLTLAAAGAGPVLLALGGWLAPAALLAALMVRELRRTPSARAEGPRTPGTLAAVAREAAPLGMAVLLVALYTRINIVFVNLGEDDVGVGEYLFAFGFIEQVIVAAAVLAGALLPLLAARATSVALLRDSQTHGMIVGAAAFGALMAAALLAVAEPLVLLVGGPTLRGAAEPLVLLSPMALMIFLAFVLAYLFTALGQAPRYLALNAVGLVFTLAANAALTLPFGAPAAARLTWATELVVVALASVAILRSGRSGRLACARLAGMAVVSVGCAEAVAAGLPHLAGAIALGVGAVAIARRELAALWRGLRRRPTDAALA